MRRERGESIREDNVKRFVVVCVEETADILGGYGGACGSCFLVGEAGESWYAGVFGDVIVVVRDV